MDPTKTMFVDLRAHAAEVIRVQTESSVYFVAVHEQRGRRFVVVRGAEGSDREHVVVRDSDPRIGERSLFEVPLAEWPGQTMEVATMRTSVIVTATREPDPTGTSFPDKVFVKVAAPTGMIDAPRIVQALGKGTNVGQAHPGPALGKGTNVGQAQSAGIARRVVVGEGPALPYPLRHVRYAEDVAVMLRSLNQRDRIFDDVDPELRQRLVRALEDSADLLKLILRRAK